jgi:hypothetical protein
MYRGQSFWSVMQFSFFQFKVAMLNHFQRMKISTTKIMLMAQPKKKKKTGVKNLLKCSSYTIFKFSFFLPFFIEIWHNASCIFWLHITTFIRKKNTRLSVEFAFEGELSIRLQKYATVLSDKHIATTIIFFLYELSPGTMICIK